MSDITKKLDKMLSSLTDLEYQQLILTVENSKLIEGIQKQFLISNKEMAKRLGITVNKLHKMKRGCFNFDLKYLAKLEMIAKEEIEKSQLVQIRLSKK